MNREEYDIEEFRPNLPRIDIGSFKWVIIGGLVVALLASSVYQVPAQYQGVVLRFGKDHKTVEPGLNFKLPFGIDKVEKVPVRRTLKAEFGFATREATNPYQHSEDPREFKKERSMVSGDLNAALVDWVVQYHITDPREYLFNVRSPGPTLRDAAESVMREVVGDRTVDEVITVGRQEIETQAQLKLQELINRYAMGLSIDQIQLKDVNPPIQVQPSFNEVNEAQQEREQKVNVARGEYNKAIPEAKGIADQQISEARGYAIQRINEAEGDASRFTAVFDEYLKAPEVTRQRIFLETMSEVLPTLGPKIILDDEAKQILPFLQVPQGRKTQQLLSK